MGGDLLRPNVRGGFLRLIRTIRYSPKLRQAKIDSPKAQTKPAPAFIQADFPGRLAVEVRFQRELLHPFLPFYFGPLDCPSPLRYDAAIPIGGSRLNLSEPAPAPPSSRENA